MANARVHIEDVKEGQELPAFEIKVSRTHIVKYAGAGGDFNPIHHDEEYARALGLPSVFAMGMMHAGFLSRVITDWAGDGRIKRYKARFQTIVWPNDTLTCKGRVLRIYREGDEHLVDCELSVVNQKGETNIIGEATVSLPSKGAP